MKIFRKIKKALIAHQLKLKRKSLFRDIMKIHNDFWLLERVFLSPTIKY